MRIVGIGSYLPKDAWPSSRCDRHFGWPIGTVLEKTGVACRYVCGPKEDQISMGRCAAERALEHAQLGPSDIDLIVGASAVPYQPIPATAPLLQRELGIRDAGAFAFDVNSTCLGFLTALDVAHSLLSSGKYERALIVSSEVASRALPWSDGPEVAGLFGDGAAAVIVEVGDGKMTALFETYPSAYEACRIGAGGTRFDFWAEQEAFAAHSRFQMSGKELYRVTSKHFSPFLSRLISNDDCALSDVDLIVPHQASPHALARMIAKCGLAPDKVVNICHEVGNQIAASIPFALDQAKAKLTVGSKLLMLGTSAGVSFGGVALEL